MKLLTLYLSCFIYFIYDEFHICCILVSCGRVYHKECLKSWPQASWGNGLGKETLRCPQHYCHTCISDNPAVLKNKQCNETLMKCIKCPTSYHKSTLFSFI